MVIQRWQSVLLLIATFAMAAACYMPVGVIENSSTAPTDFPIYLILNILAAIMAFVDIFLYDNLKFQITVAKVTALLALASVITGLVIVYYTVPGMMPAWNGSIVLAACAFLLLLRAQALMKKDRKTLDSYDRLR